MHLCNYFKFFLHVHEENKKRERDEEKLNENGYLLTTSDFLLHACIQIYLVLRYGIVVEVLGTFVLVLSAFKSHFTSSLSSISFHDSHTQAVKTDAKKTKNRRKE